ncbi:MAG: FAD-dependent oxidoreductase [Simkaniaceae bacterium]|nr:FAD-dependent oxidoreductase [Candidatus Sacchlamyda saccharinae]
MKIAIIGAGFAGLGAAYFFLEAGAAVTIFEKERVGAGASGVASGLLHPYPGLSARRSVKASEALMVTRQLIRVAEKHTSKMVATESGIFRKSMGEEQHARLHSHALEYGDVEHKQEDLFLIHSGSTVVSENYLQGLSSALSNMGALFVIQNVQSLNELENFDHIVIASGHGVRNFDECKNIKVKFLKGQALSMEGEPPHEKSFISRGYIAHVGSSARFEIGSTYEKEFSSIEPDLETAKKLLQDKLDLCTGSNIVACRSGVRVCPIGHYAPIIEKVGEKATVFTGLGSRGLLYHGLYGRMLAAQILQKS